MSDNFIRTSKKAEFTPEEIAKAKLYTEHVMHETEDALIGEIEKVEGKVPSNEEIAQFGVQRLNKDMSMDYCWKGKLVIKVKPGQTNEKGERGVLIEVFGDKKHE